MDANDRIIIPTPNWQHKTFTLRVYTAARPYRRIKYRTCPMNEVDFCKAYLGQWDWGEYLDNKKGDNITDTVKDGKEGENE